MPAAVIVTTVADPVADRKAPRNQPTAEHREEMRMHGCVGNHIGDA
jgi:hypothetical protein